MRIAVITRAREEDEAARIQALINGSHELAKAAGENALTEVWRIAAEGYFPVPEDCVEPVSDMAKRRKPDALLFSGDIFGNELAARIECVLNGSAASCVESFSAKDKKIYAVKRVYASNLFARFSLDKRPYLLTLANGAFAKDERAESIETVDLQAAPGMGRNFISRKFIPAEKEERRLEDAKVIVAGGRGMGSKEKTQKLDELAELMDAGVGSSRPPVMDSWTAHSRLIGASGKTVKPELCLTFGISGAGPFMAGVEKSGIIAAVNTDPDALIFNYCDYGIIADCNEAADALKDILSERKETQNG